MSTNLRFEARPQLSLSDAAADPRRYYSNLGLEGFGACGMGWIERAGHAGPVGVQTRQKNCRAGDAVGSPPAHSTDSDIWFLDSRMRFDPD